MWIKSIKYIRAKKPQEIVSTIMNQLSVIKKLQFLNLFQRSLRNIIRMIQRSNWRTNVDMKSVCDRCNIN